MLENMLGVVLATESLKSWSIFQEKSGGVTFKLRFIGSPDHDNTTANAADSVYKKKSPSQIQRDRARATSWRSSCGVTTRSQSSRNEDTSRKVGDAPPDMELPRAGSSDSSHFNLGPQLDTPDTVCCSTPAEQLSADLGIQTEQCMDLVNGYSHDYPNFPNNQFTPDCVPSESVCDDRDVDIVPVHVDTTELSRESSFQSSDSDDNIGLCDDGNCCYGSGSDQIRQCYKCTQCSSAGSVLYICTKCYADGGHKSHRNYMTLVPLDNVLNDNNFLV